METLTSNQLRWLKYIPAPHQKTFNKARHLIHKQWRSKSKVPLNFRSAHKIILQLLKEQEAPLEDPNTTYKGSQDEAGRRLKEDTQSQVSRRTVKEPRSNPPISVSSRIW